MRRRIASANAVLFVTPEYNRSVPAALFDQSGTLVNASTRDFLSKFMAAFAEWVELNLRPA